MPPLDNTISLNEGSSHNASGKVAWFDTYSLTSSTVTKYIEYELKNALQGVESSVNAVLDFLVRNGVSRASIDELRSCKSKVNMQNALNVGGLYFTILERSQEYMNCLNVLGKLNNNSSDTTTTSLATSTIYLLMNAWTHLCKYVALQYRVAHKEFHSLRHQQDCTFTSQNPAVIDVGRGRLLVAAAAYAASGGNYSIQQQHKILVQQALKYKTDLAELCCACQKSLLLLQAREKWLIMTRQ